MERAVELQIIVILNLVAVIKKFALCHVLAPSSKNNASILLQTIKLKITPLVLMMCG